MMEEDKQIDSTDGAQNEEAPRPIRKYNTGFGKKKTD